ncbi:MAG TPA: response regulator transcription factor [Puia sp.]|jgi:two-component system invasion response regulator UvrY
MKNFLLIDDHEVVRSGIKQVLLESFRPCHVYEAWDQSSAIHQLKERQHQLVVMDVHMPGSNAIELMRHIRAGGPAVPVLIFSIGAEKVYARKFIKAGASGYLTKSSSLTEFKKAVDMILLGRKYMGPFLGFQFFAAPGNDEFSNPFEKLSKREFEIALLLISGQTVTYISKLLRINTSTVGTHKAHILAKLEISNLTELQEIAKMHRLK